MEQERFVTQVQLGGMPFAHEQPENISNAIAQLVKDESGRVLDIYPLLGNESADLQVVCQFPNNTAALKAWLALGHKYGWRTTTNPSPTFEVFQEIYQSILSTPIATAGSVARGSSTGR